MRSAPRLLPDRPESIANVRYTADVLVCLRATYKLVPELSLIASPLAPGHEDTFDCPLSGKFGDLDHSRKMNVAPLCYAARANNLDRWMPCAGEQFPHCIGDSSRDFIRVVARFTMEHDVRSILLEHLHDSRF